MFRRFWTGPGLRALEAKQRGNSCDVDSGDKEQLGQNEPLIPAQRPRRREVLGRIQTDLQQLRDLLAENVADLEASHRELRDVVDRFLEARGVKLTAALEKTRQDIAAAIEEAKRRLEQ